MKVFLDDVRLAPRGWVQCNTADDCKTLLLSGGVEELSLDHDLGDDDQHGTGADVLDWIERELMTQTEWTAPMSITVHSANPVARKRMGSVVERIIAMSSKASNPMVITMQQE